MIVLQKMAKLKLIAFLLFAIPKQEAWFIKGRHGRSASGYLEAHLKYVRRCMNQHDSKGNVHSGVKKVLS